METNSLQDKPSNPKDIIGSNKLPLHLWPQTATAYGCLALLDGMLKYGRSNWRAVGVNATIYYDALDRHITAWFEGEDIDPDSGLPHLAHALACLAILVDAQAAGKLNDNRFYPGGFRKTVEAVTPHVARLKEKYKDRSPKHYTIQDAPEQDYGDECCQTKCEHAESVEPAWMCPKNFSCPACAEIRAGRIPCTSTAADAFLKSAALAVEEEKDAVAAWYDDINSDVRPEEKIGGSE